VIVGPTASGKSDLAIALALRTRATLGCDVEIVSGDAMAVYRGMDVGTAKPTVDERAGIPHHLIDVVDASEEFTVSRFKDEVDAALAGIEARGAVPILVGGTGLYVQSVVDQLEIPGHFPEIRAELEATPPTDAATITLWARLRELDPAAAAKMEPNNRRRVIRALEVCLGAGRPFSSFGPGIDAYPATRFAMAGLRIERDVMDARIDARYERQMAAGFLDEVRTLLEAPGGLSRSAAQALGYKELAAHLRGELPLDEALDAARARTRRFARRQQRWFNRDPRITWFVPDADDLVAEVETWWEKAST
jgi:tRNA dimethylallyltransferase